MSALFDEYRRRAHGVYVLLSQGTWWFPQRPREPIRIVDMDERWRRNVVRFLERRADTLALLHAMGEIQYLSQPVWNEVIGEDTNGAPVTRGTPLSDLDIMSDHAMDTFDATHDAAINDPETWLTSTPLYRALTAERRHVRASDRLLCTILW